MNTCEYDTTGVASYSNRLIGGVFSRGTVNCAVHTTVPGISEDLLSGIAWPGRNVTTN
jgi:hypothetical protein